MHSDQMPDNPGHTDAGRRFWQQINAEYDFEVHDVPVLVEAVRTIDALEDLDTAVRDNGAMVPGQRGSMVVNPAITAAGPLRQTLARLLAALKIPDSSTGYRPISRRVRGPYKVG